MHEFSLAADVLTIVQGSVDEHRLSHVLEVRVDVGNASGVSIDALTFAWEYMRSTVEATRCAKLAINNITAVGTCRTCGHHGELSDWMRLCPSCSAPGFQLDVGTEFMVTGISGE